ncbi:MAG: hypothetical protein CM1200mP2_41160 [Planctomycetaceae bacterium]|nr:MAG: hypothetical protein CM1200mP2_41160 [Planctomycetaceae bacterium]
MSGTGWLWRFLGHRRPDWLDRVGAPGGQDGACCRLRPIWPWGGSITFDSLTTWHFGPSTTGLDPLKSISIRSRFTNLALAGDLEREPVLDPVDKRGGIRGPGTLAEFDGLANVPLAADDGHWGEGVTDDGQEAAMDPSWPAGNARNSPSWILPDGFDRGWALLPETYTIDVAEGFPGHSILIEDDTIASDYRSRVTIDGSETVTFLVPADVLRSTVPTEMTRSRWREWMPSSRPGLLSTDRMVTTRSVHAGIRLGL